EIPAADENGPARVLRPVQNKVWIGTTVRKIAPRVEQELAVARALDPLHELRRDYLVRIHVDAGQRRDDSGEALEWFHYQSRMSTKCPAMAAAAAICGLTRCVRPPLP